MKILKDKRKKVNKRQTQRNTDENYSSTTFLPARNHGSKNTVEKHLSSASRKTKTKAVKPEFCT